MIQSDLAFRDRLDMIESMEMFMDDFGKIPSKYELTGSIDYHPDYAYFTRNKEQVFLQEFIDSSNVLCPLRGYIGRSTEHFPFTHSRLIDWDLNGKHGKEENDLDIKYKIPYPKVTIENNVKYMTKSGQRVVIFPEESNENHNGFVIEGDHRSPGKWTKNGKVWSCFPHSSYLEIVPVNWLNSFLINS